MLHLSRKLSRFGRSLAFQALNSSSSSAEPKIDYLGLLFFGGLTAGTFTLGAWQVKRFFWKLQVIDDSKMRIQAPVETLPLGGEQYQLQELVKELKGRRVEMKGKYLHDREVLLGPRSAPAGLFGTPAQGLAMNPQGYYLITPFRREDGTIIFMNRGWVSDAVVGRGENSHVNNTDADVAWDRPQGTVIETAVASAAEQSGTFTPTNKPVTGKLLWLELPSLVAAARLTNLEAPVIFERIVPDDEDAEYYPAARRQKMLDNHHVTPETHAVYAFTWFSLASYGAYWTYRMFFKKKRRRLR